jgi:hypothetical protein
MQQWLPVFRLGRFLVSWVAAKPWCFWMDERFCQVSVLVRAGPVLQC